MPIPNVEPEEIEQALRDFDQQKRGQQQWLEWESKNIHDYAIRWQGKLYPVKEIVRMATGETDFSGGRSHANRYVEERGFEVVSLRDKEKQPRIWKISPGRSGREWQKFLEQNLIGIGFEEYWQGDLKQFRTHQDLLSALDSQKYPAARGSVANQLWYIRQQIKEGDIIVAYGRKTIMGQGKVIGPYQYQEADLQFPFPHRRPVEWDDEFEAIPVTQLSEALQEKLGRNVTLLELTQEEYTEIVASNAPKSVTKDFFPLELLSTYFKHRGYQFPKILLATFITALQTKGFVILSGLSGTGKTKLAQILADLLPKPEELIAIQDVTEDGSISLSPVSPVQKYHYLPNHEFISVRPDWRDNKSLLGYYNPLTGGYEDTPFLRFLLRAKDHYDKFKAQALPHFIILDEMNLARVEYYFSDFLSVLESSRDETGYTWEAIQLHNQDPEQTFGSSGLLIPESIKLPPNLYIIGTVNMDETTHAFSPKVLDRAFTIEFNEVDFDDYPPTTGTEINEAQKSQLQQVLLSSFQREGDFTRIDKVELADAVPYGLDYRRHLQILNKALFDYDLHFGYRVFDEIARFLVIAAHGELFDKLEVAFDVAILMKVLPKFNGPRNRLRQPLEQVIVWAKNPDEDFSQALVPQLKDANHCRTLLKQLPGDFVYPETARKAIRMLIRLHETGFASFA